MRVITTVDAFGERVAGSSADRWAVSYGDYVTLWDGEASAGDLRLREQALDLRYDGDVLLAAPSLPGEELPPLHRALERWRVVAATWAGEQLLVAMTAPDGGHEQRVRLYDGRTREPGPVLWADTQWMRV